MSLWKNRSEKPEFKIFWQVKEKVLDKLANMPNTAVMKCCGTRKTREDYKTQARIHKALANEARLMIVDWLSDCECSVGELVEAVKLDISTVSKHLAVLLSVGIVDNRKDGNTVRYRLLTPCILDMFKCTSAVMKERKD